MFVNILSTVTCEKYMHESFRELSIIISLAVMTPLILVFGEIVPKILAFQLKRKLVVVISPFIRVLFYILYPLQWVIFVLSTPFNTLFLSIFPRQDARKGTAKYNKDEINAAIEIGRKRNIFDDYEKTLIKNMLSFDSITAKYIVTPRTEIFSIDITKPMKTIKESVYRSEYSRIPFYDSDKDNIEGVLLRKDIFNIPNIFKNKKIFKGHLKEAFFVPETIKIKDLFRVMVKRKTHIHFVVDEYGGLEGLLTLEDILSEIFGKTKEDKNVGEDFRIKKGSQNTYIVKASITLEEFNKHLKPEINDSDSVTLGGFMEDKLGHIPKSGDAVEYNHYVFKAILTSDRKSILVEVAPSLPNHENRIK